MASRIVAAIVATVCAHPGRWAAAGILVMVGSAALGVRVSFQDDVRALVAGGDKQVAEQLQALSEFTSIDELLIMLDSAQTPEQLNGAAEVLVQELRRSGLFRRVRSGVDPAAQMDLLAALLPRRFLLDPRDPDDLFAAETLRGNMVTLRELLLSPQGILGKRLLLGDPVGSLRAALAEFSGAPGLSKLDATRGQFASADGGSLLVIATPKGEPFRGREAARTMGALARAKAAVSRVAPDVVMRPIGAHRFARDAEAMIRRDVHRSAAMTLAIVLALFVAFFRRPVLVCVALPPLLFGACVAGGVTGFIGKPVHGIVLAFAAACLGLSIDYTIHLLSATAAAASKPTREALIEGARSVGGSVFLAAVSTMAGLWALSLSGVPALKQMAHLAMGAVAGAFLGNLLWLPIVLPWVAPKVPSPAVVRGPWRWLPDLAIRHPRAVAAVTVVVAALCAVLALETAFDGDLRHLDTHTPEAMADEEAFAAAFGDPSESGLVVISAADAAEALERAGVTVQRLAEAGIGGVFTPTVLAPPPSLAKERRRRWCARDFAAELSQAGVAMGFRAQAFVEFARDLRRLCAPEGEALLDPEPALAVVQELLGRPVVRPSPDGGVRLAVAFAEPPDTRENAVRALAALSYATVVDRAELTEQLVRVIAQDLPVLAAVAWALVALILLVAYRSLGEPLRALAPCMLAMLATLGILAAAQIPVNLMNICVFPLLAGLGIDYGILMTDAARQARPVAATTERAFSVTLAAATTLGGFGTLAIARYYAIATIGRSVLLAVTLAALFALLIPTALARLRTRTR